MLFFNVVLRLSWFSFGSEKTGSKEGWEIPGFFLLAIWLEVLLRNEWKEVRDEGIIRCSGGADARTLLWRAVCTGQFGQSAGAQEFLERFACVDYPPPVDGGYRRGDWSIYDHEPRPQRRAALLYGQSWPVRRTSHHAGA